MERKYSITEIDRMRWALLWLQPETHRHRTEHEWAIEVESRLRTHMQNGTDPDELEKQAVEYSDGEFDPANPY